MKGLQLTKEAFEAEWWSYVQTGLGYMEAYRQLEQWHLEKFGSCRYASYVSFANSKSNKKGKPT
jgi:hypothetical protein